MIYKDGSNRNWGYPPSNFHFEVSVGAFPGVDCLFSEVSGIEMSREFERLNEGGNNNSAIRLPGQTNYKDLELKRGIVPSFSPLFLWVELSLTSSFMIPLVPMPIQVKLLDENGDSLITWLFMHAIPKSLSVGKLDASKGEVLVESMTFSYSSFTRAYWNGYGA
jgi:phage tail-like protein